MFEILQVPRGSLEILAFCVCFRVVHFFLNNYGPLPSALVSSSPKKIWVYRNISISFIHACISAFLSVYCFVDEPAMLTDMFSAWSRLSYFLVSLSAGYFLHDFFDMLFYDAKHSVDLLIHHVVVCMAFYIAIHYNMYMGYAVCALLMEINSVFLHFRRLMGFHGVSKSSVVYQINGILLLITFVNFRFLTAAWMLNYSIKYRHEVPHTHFLFSVVGLVIMTVLNLQLLMSLWKADFKCGQLKQREE